MKLSKCLLFVSSILSLQIGFAAQIIAIDPNFQSLSPTELKKISTTVLNHETHTRYQQLVNGFPIYGFHIIKHQTPEGTSFTGHQLQYTSKDQFPIQAQFNMEEAFNKASTFLNDPDFKSLQHKRAALMYYLDDSQQIHLAYVLNYFIADPTTPRRPYAIVDAITGKILKSWQGLTTERFGQGPGGNEKIGKYYYGTQFCPIDVKVSEDRATCWMDNPHVRTINLENETSGSKAFQFQCPEHSGEYVNGSYSVINDAQYFGTVVYDMYQNWYHVPALTFKMLMRVHYSREYENAFWNGKNLTFGDGKDHFYPFMSADVVAHEVAHGFTEQHAGLEYWGQSGSINESFSDMSGKAAEQYVQLHFDWTIGSKFTKKEPALRYMDNPSKDGKSIDDARDYRPELDVHYGSGVYNRAFYYLANMKDWSPKKAFEIMLRANAIYWEPLSTFTAAAEGTIQAAQDLHYSAEDVAAAFYKVGLNCELLSDGRHYDCMTRL